MLTLMKGAFIRRGIRTDSSILLVYPPEKELDFREQLLDGCFPALETQGTRVHALDLTGVLFEGLSEDAVEALREEEFDDYEWMLHGLSRRVEISLRARLEALATQHPGGNCIVYSTVSLYPLVRFGEVLRNMRDLHVRIALAFPGEERGGKLHFMNQPDGGNYLAVKLFWR
ncbi:MAG: hypothetical protein OXC29_15000 [Rhodococcus sp.]|nr:hypothetical protein [Rhodococcus sp. (in: high G+C Gram-positive bacteria)]